MRAIITLHPTKYILALCPINKVPFDQVPIYFCNRVQFSSGYLLTQTSIQVDFSFWWMHFATGNFIDSVSDWLIFLYIADNERVTVEQKCLFSLLYTVKFISVLMFHF